MRCSIVLALSQVMLTSFCDGCFRDWYAWSLALVFRRSAFMDLACGNFYWLRSYVVENDWYIESTMVVLNVNVLENGMTSGYASIT